MAENPRTTTARETDDHELIDAAIADSDPAIEGSSGGGHLQTDIGSQADRITDVDDPEAHLRPEKADAIANGQAYDGDRRGNSG